MAKLFDTESRIVPAWAAISRHLLDTKTPSSGIFNVVVEISDPLNFTNEDEAILQSVDASYLSNGAAQPLNTVANTIFPQSLYDRYQRPDFYSKYSEIAKQMRVMNPTWGTYAQRMMQPNRNVAYSPKDNQLECMVLKIENVVSGQVNRRVAAYELNVIGEPASSVQEFTDEAGGDITLYSPNCDKKKYMGMPCLSHVSFNLDKNNCLHLSALYRSHYYGERALGNFIGLARLLSFVARESGATVGKLTCLSTYALFDAKPFGGKKAARALLKKVL